MQTRIGRLAPPLLSVVCLWACKPASDAPWKFETARVDVGPLAAKVAASGTLSALVTVQVGTQVSGRVAEIKADFNQQVKKGDVLARIDPRLFQAAVEQARANVAAGDAALKRAEIDAREAQRKYDRAKALADQNSLAVSDAEAAKALADSAVAQLEVLRSNLQQAKAALHQTEINLALTTIVSPIDGMVISRAVDVGQTVAASLQAPTLFTIAEDLRKMQVDASVAEADIGRLKPDMDASFTVDAYPGKRFHGKVRQIRHAPQTVQNVVTYDVVVDVDNSELQLRPGMTATVSVEYSSREKALRIPNAALRFKAPPEWNATRDSQREGPSPEPRAKPQLASVDKPAWDRRTVWVLRDNTPVPATVRVGISDGSMTEMADGSLKEGDLLITEATNPAEKKAPPMGGPGMRRVL